MFVYFGWGVVEKKPDKIDKARFVFTFFCDSPPIFVASDTFGPIFHADMVQARLISLCDRCDGDSSAVIIETQPPLCRIAVYLSFMDAAEGRKTNNRRRMELFPYSAPLRSLLMAVSLAPAIILMSIY